LSYLTNAFFLFTSDALSFEKTRVFYSNGCLVSE
jgi:hypothetical protein